MTYKNWNQAHSDQLNKSSKLALKITDFAGTLRFIYIHIAWWGAWFIINLGFLHLTFDRYPYSLLTMILSLEAIVLGTLIMIGQNSQSSRDKIQAEHQYKHQELELVELRKINKQQLDILNEQTEMLDALHAVVGVKLEKQKQKNKPKKG